MNEKEGYSPAAMRYRTGCCFTRLEVIDSCFAVLCCVANLPSIFSGAVVRRKRPWAGNVGKHRIVEDFWG